MQTCGIRTGRIERMVRRDGRGQQHGMSNAPTRQVGESFYHEVTAARIAAQMDRRMGPFVRQAGDQRGETHRTPLEPMTPDDVGNDKQ